MKISYDIHDNFLSNDEFTKIHDTLLSHEFPWYFSKSIGYDEQKDIQSLYEQTGKIYNETSGYFMHMFYSSLQIRSDFFHLLMPILQKLQLKSLIRVKGNFYINQLIDRNVIHDKHVDYDFSHKGAIFYINTNNGHTILDDGTRVNSVANRLLLFDPSIPHSSTDCTDMVRRVNINFNYF